MKIYLHEISEFGTELTFNENEKWVADAISRADEHLDELSQIKPSTPNPRPILVELNLRQVDEVVVIDGKLRTHIELVCSRCANVYDMPVKPSISALYCKDPDMAGVAHLQADPEDKRAPGKPVGQNKGFARHKHDFGQDANIESGKDLDINYIAEDYIDLADVLTEQIQLQVPFQPLCKADCKGMCTQCGADLNVGRCACAKITASNAFSALKDLKIKER
ncbi:MAG: DUF177 domain-containing protein [Methylotenera sp.]|nr:DUF177 domain-containing protein [Oligoflexia bacterium]